MYVQAWLPLAQLHHTFQEGKMYLALFLFLKIKKEFLFLHSWPKRTHFSLQGRFFFKNELGRTKSTANQQQSFQSKPIRRDKIFPNARLKMDHTLFVAVTGSDFLSKMTSSKLDGHTHTQKNQTVFKCTTVANASDYREVKVSVDLPRRVKNGKNKST